MQLFVLFANMNLMEYNHKIVNGVQIFFKFFNKNGAIIIKDLHAYNKLFLLKVYTGHIKLYMDLILNNSSVFEVITFIQALKIKAWG